MYSHKLNMKLALMNVYTKLDKSKRNSLYESKLQSYYNMLDSRTKDLKKK